MLSFLLCQEIIAVWYVEIRSPNIKKNAGKKVTGVSYVFTAFT